MKLRNYLLAGTALVALSFTTACSEDETVSNGNNTETPGTEENESQTDSNVIVWPSDTIVNLTNHYTVPEGKSLIIKAGAQIIVSTAGVGANHAPIEFKVLPKNQFYSRFRKMNVQKQIHWKVCGEVS